jgi:hypothetical protein
MAMNINNESVIRYARAYDEAYQKWNYRVEMETKSVLCRRKYLTKEQLKKIGIWKSPRIERHYRKHNEETVREISRFSFATTSEEARILCLISLTGVNFPVASTILHFAFPDKYPIMDFRVIRSLGWQQPSKYDFRFWQRYCKKIATLSRRLCLPIRTVEKALWKYDKDRYS